MKLSLCRAAVALAAVQLGLPAGFEVVRFHDEDRSSIHFRQILFPSERRGMAIGSLVTEGRERPIVAVTSDAGKTWADITLSEPAVSLYCLEESACWLVTTGGVWFSTETGRSWQRLSKEKLLTRVWFTARDRGWAIGAERKLLETRDGGRTWSRLAVTDEVKTSDPRTVFHALAFIGETRGIIAGRVEPRRSEGPFPVWMQSEPEQERETPTLSIVLETPDGGGTWRPSTTSMFGRISTVRSWRGVPFALALIEFDRFFTYPSEVFRIDARSGDSRRILRDKSFAVTDVAVLPDGSALAAGFEPHGSVARIPVPSKVRVMRSVDLALWTQVEVDYRTVARRVSVSVAPDSTVWMATDTGMILKCKGSAR